MYLSNHEKSEIIERSFGIPHPMKALAAGLRRQDDREITPFQMAVMRKEVDEVIALGYSEEDAMIVVLMGGGRIEAVAAATFGSRYLPDVGEVIESVKARMRQVDMEPLIGLTYRKLNLLRRA